MDINALRKISYGLYIIGSFKDGRRNGQIANTVFQITSEPPTVSVSINRNNLTHEFIKSTGVYTVSILNEGAPLPFIGGFGFKSGRDTDKLKDVDFKTGQSGAPVILQHANAYLEVKVITDIDIGTHTIFIGGIMNAEVLNEEPSITYEYYQKIKRGTTPKSAPSYIAK